MSEDEARLLTLLVAAGEAPPSTRIEFRDQIAAFGELAIHALETDEWIGDPRYAAFAIQTIKRAGEIGARSEAVAALQRALAAVTRPEHAADTRTALASLGATEEKRTRQARQRDNNTEYLPAPTTPEGLRVGGTYRRSELHDAGLGGNRQGGASCPAGGAYCLLFSNPERASEHGYHDAPVGATGYRFFGHWGGQGDMTMTSGNKQILDRSPELYLFRARGNGLVTYMGQYEVDGWAYEPAVRDGKQVQAIVFSLQALDR